MASARAIERTFPGPRGDIWIDPPPSPASDYNNRAPKRLKKERARTARRHSPSPLRAPRPLPPCPPRAEPPPRPPPPAARAAAARALAATMFLGLRRGCWAEAEAISWYASRSCAIHATNTCQLPDHQSRPPKSFTKITKEKRCHEEQKVHSSEHQRLSAESAGPRTHGRS